MQHINISVSNDEKNFYGKDEYGNNNCNKEDINGNELKAIGMTFLFIIILILIMMVFA